MYNRILNENLYSYFNKGKVLILTGCRQCGKTTLVNSLLKEKKLETITRRFNCDNFTDRDLLSDKDLEKLIPLIGNSKLVFIDEGQKVSSIGETLKLLVDHYKTNLQIIVTGSSSINLLTSTQEPLTGRKLVFHLYPLSVQEIYSDKNYLAFLKNMNTGLIYGGYPEVFTQTDIKFKERLLNEICSSYLFKDIFEFQKVKNPMILTRLLKALAFQIGSEVSYNELSKMLGIDKNTVETYIDLLEKSYVIFRLPPYFKNKRKELTKHNKIFFNDLGIRNVLINNFNPPENRNDMGQIWENFLITERIKYCNNNDIRSNFYFWRTYDGAEVDLVEEHKSELKGYEFKWGSKKTSAPSGWLDYENATWNRIEKSNLEGFVF